MPKVHQINHPLLAHSLTILRNRNSDTECFRRHTDIVSQIMIMEAAREISIDERLIQMPLTEYRGAEIHRSLIFVPVLRAGISMLFPARDFLP